MDITVRLYKLHDYDLIYLYKNLRFPIKDAIKKALIAYVRNESVFFEVPVEKVSEDNLNDIKNAQFHIKLDEEEEKDIIDFLAGLKRFYRNSFLKNLLRGYLAGPATYVYEEQPDIKEVEERSTVIKDNILGIEKLPQMKKRKKREKHIILTEDQKKLLDPTASGLFDDVDIIIKK